MNKFIAVVLALMLGWPGLAAAFEENEFGEQPWYGGRRSGSGQSSNQTPLYYRPTQRYYGHGYTVSYRYVPVYQRDGVWSLPARAGSNFRTEAFLLPTEEAKSWGANPPRLTVRDPKSAVVRTAITSIIRKTPKGKTPTKAAAETTPAIVPSAPTPENP